MDKFAVTPGGISGTAWIRAHHSSARVNYRANIWALSKCGAKAIVSVASVGSIRADLKPGDVVIPHQIIDYTWGRKSTYHEGQDSPVVHIDFTEPYDRSLRELLIKAAGIAGVAISDSGVPTRQRRVPDSKRWPRLTAWSVTVPILSG